MGMDLNLVTELQATGFSKTQATIALCSGNSSMEAAIYWIIDRENDTTSSEMPKFRQVPAIIPVEAFDSSHISEQVKLRSQASRNIKRKQTKKGNWKEKGRSTTS